MRYQKSSCCLFHISQHFHSFDFEFEFQLAAANEHIDPNVEMVFLMTSTGKGFISSSNVKDFYAANVDISSLVPSIVVDIFKSKEK